MVGATAPLWPALGALYLGLSLVLQRRITEDAATRVAQLTLWISFWCTAFAGAAWAMNGFHPVDERLGHWYRAGRYGFELSFYLDAISVGMMFLVSILLLATRKFSATYLHREPGFVRFTVLMQAFAAGIQLLVLGGSYDLLLAGWEVVGFTSVFLVAFFHERTGPVNAAVRVLVTYRICDVGLLLGAVLLHQATHTTLFGEVFSDRHRVLLAPVVATPIGLALLFGAMGKSAQFPVGGWLPRAMEGPTASSAVFYGGLSVHAGVYLMIRSYPLFDDAPIVLGAIVIIGLVTAAMAALSGQASPDAKSALAYATVSQVGLMFVEVGLGFPKVALLHLIAHTFLRYYQFLRTPSVLQDALGRRSALGATVGDVMAAKWEERGIGLRRLLFRMAIQRFDVETTLERWVARPAIRLAIALDGLDQWRLGSRRDTKEARP
jgi:NADH:ubiquinone oxidoreductase subunit 5 (subunit L)/multisubunit Na+/H+ antiporter MnhA subunit